MEQRQREIMDKVQISGSSGGDGWQEIQKNRRKKKRSKENEFLIQGAILPERQ